MRDDRIFIRVFLFFLCTFIVYLFHFSYVLTVSLDVAYSLALYCHLSPLFTTFPHFTGTLPINKQTPIVYRTSPHIT